MNVEKGDLAFTIGTKPTELNRRNTGYLVEVVEYIGFHTSGCGKQKPNVWLCRIASGGQMLDVWGFWQGPDVFIDDANLRPIRSEPGADQTLTWTTAEVSA